MILPYGIHLKEIWHKITNISNIDMILKSLHSRLQSDIPGAIKLLSRLIWTLNIMDICKYCVIFDQTLQQWSYSLLFVPTIPLIVVITWYQLPSIIIGSFCKYNPSPMHHASHNDSWTNIAALSRRHFQSHFPQWNSLYFYSNFTEVYLLGSCW